jgi:hypothetical protein
MKFFIEINAPYLHSNTPTRQAQGERNSISELIRDVGQRISHGGDDVLFERAHLTAKLKIEE